MARHWWHLARGRDRSSDRSEDRSSDRSEDRSSDRSEDHSTDRSAERRLMSPSVGADGRELLRGRLILEGLKERKAVHTSSSQVYCAQAPFPDVWPAKSCCSQEACSQRDSKPPSQSTSWFPSTL
jgi:hypothetical protein